MAYSMVANTKQELLPAGFQSSSHHGTGPTVALGSSQWPGRPLATSSLSCWPPLGDWQVSGAYERGTTMREQLESYNWPPVGMSCGAGRLRQEEEPASQPASQPGPWSACRAQLSLAEAADSTGERWFASIVDLQRQQQSTIRPIVGRELVRGQARGFASFSSWPPAFDGLPSWPAVSSSS